MLFSNTCSDLQMDFDVTVNSVFEKETIDEFNARCEIIRNFIHVYNDV